MKNLTLVLSVTMLAFVAMSAISEEASAFHRFAFALLDDVVVPPDDGLDTHARMVFFQGFRGKISVFGFAKGLDPDAPLGYVSLL